MRYQAGRKLLRPGVGTNHQNESEWNMAQTTRTPAEIATALAEPFDVAEVHFKPGVVSGNRALALAYADARAIQDRLDDVLGVDGWQDDYDCLPYGSVVCRLRIRLGDEWITKVDVGSPSEQPDGGDRLKAAFSDALKRVAVKFGIGRYLYRIPSQWTDYDPKRKQFTGTPQLPAWAIPGKASTAATKPQTQPTDGTDLLRRLTGLRCPAGGTGLVRSRRLGPARPASCCRGGIWSGHEEPVRGGDQLGGGEGEGF